MTSRNQLNTVDQNRSTSREMTKANQATPPSLSSHGSRARTPVPPTKDTADAWRTESYCPLDTTPIAPLPAAIRKLQGPKLTAMFIDDKEPPSTFFDLAFVRVERSERFVILMLGNTVDIKETRAVQKHLAAYKWPPCDPAKVWRDTADQRNRLYILNNERHEPCSRGEVHAPHFSRTSLLQRRSVFADASLLHRYVPSHRRLG